MVSVRTALMDLAKRVRRHSLGMIYHAGSGHPGGSLSAADILTVLYARELRPKPPRLDRPPDRDRFILSKGHACPALYAIAAEVGLLPREALAGFRKIGCTCQGHPHVGSTPFVETSTGSLGQGFSAAIGVALGLRLQGHGSRVYVMLGDGELQEGEVWEGAMCATHHGLDNLCAVVDYNKMQSDEYNKNIMDLEPLDEKWKAFGWNVLQINGHDLDAIARAFVSAKAYQGRPTAIIAHTIKGRGVSFMEGSPLWHGSVKLKREELVAALRDLDTPPETIDAYLEGRFDDV